MKTNQNQRELISDENLQKAWSILDNLKPSEIMELKRIPEERREVFISCAKQYADTHHNITFNNSFTKIRKDESIRKST
jgi:hypothetical protein